MRVVADRDVCVGAGSCELLAPDAFEVDDDAAAARDAVSQCPTGAISLLERD